MIWIRRRDWDRVTLFIFGTIYPGPVPHSYKVSPKVQGLTGPTLNSVTPTSRTDFPIWFHTLVDSIERKKRNSKPSQFYLSSVVGRETSSSSPS
jgi:hypothetical protein